MQDDSALSQNEPSPSSERLLGALLADMAHVKRDLSEVRDDVKEVRASVDELRLARAEGKGFVTASKMGLWAISQIPAGVLGFLLALQRYT